MCGFPRGNPDRAASLLDSKDAYQVEWRVHTTSCFTSEVFVGSEGAMPRVASPAPRPRRCARSDAWYGDKEEVLENIKALCSPSIR